MLYFQNENFDSPFIENEKTNTLLHSPLTDVTLCPFCLWRMENLEEFQGFQSRNHQSTSAQSLGVTGILNTSMVRNYFK